jgi:hypothetical protein
MACPVRVPRAAAAVPLAVGALLLAACRSASPPGPPSAPPVNREALAEQARREACERELAASAEALAARDAAVRTAEARAAELNLRLLEKSAELQDSADRQAALQRQLDDAIQEVVRAKAKLRSLESRADAASTMAEAEIALTALRGREANHRVRQGRAALCQREFERENYGGALFLATQAKSHLRAAETAPAPRSAPLPNEVPFASPLAYVVHTDANVREGPGMSFQVVGTVSKGALLTAVSRKNRWLRVTDDRGLTGWVFDGLLDKPATSKVSAQSAPPSLAR